MSEALEQVVEITTPRWALPLLTPHRYKGVKGGRGSGKSHERAEALVETLVMDQNLKAVCIREVQKSLKHSAKALIEEKIYSMGVSHLFRIVDNEISCKMGRGLILFQGMQDHTADSIKSLEGFNIAWVEEAHSVSKRSLELLLPTIRAEGSEIWFTWNPENETDAVDQLMLNGFEGDDDIVCVHVNYNQNPHLPDTLYKEMLRHKRRSPDTFGHVWLGEYADRSESQIMGNNYTVKAFEPGADWDGPYFGLDYGFSNDPTAGIKCWINENTLHVEYEAGKVGLELDDTTSFLCDNIPGIRGAVVRADSARPESTSYLRRKGMAGTVSVKKWPGSVEDGIEHLKSYDDIVIHPRCKQLVNEMRLYSYKVDKKSGDVLTTIVDAHNHYIDALRYALQPLIKRNSWGVV